MCFPGTSGLSARPNLKYSWEWGQPQGTQAATAPCCSHATRWSWGQRFREHWTMTRPLPHRAEPEFALLSNSAGFRAKLIPKLPLFLLLSGLCSGLACLRGGQTPSVLPCLAHQAPATCLWIIPGAKQELGHGGSQAPACLLSTFPEYRLGSSWHSAEPQAGSVAFSALGFVSGPAVSPQQNCARVSASLGTAPAGQRSAGAPVLTSLPASSRRSLPWPPRPLPVPGSPGKSSAVKAKSGLPDAGQSWPGAVGRWQPGSGED